MLGPNEEEGLSMSIQSVSRRPRRFVSVALAPLTLLERVRGRKRLLLLALYGVLLSVAGALAWRAMSLRELSDAEPFDTKALGTVHVADADNAYVLYREAARQFNEPPRIVESTDWAKVDPGVRAWVESKREALEVWLQGTERPDALNIQPRDARDDSQFELLQTIRMLATIALLEGSRREQAGDLDGAWTMYRARLRCSRHAGRHGSIVERMFGTGMLLSAEPHIEHWMNQPRMTAALLRRARRDIEVCEAMTPPLSEAFRVEYFALESALADIARGTSLGAEGMGIEGQFDDPRMWYNHVPFVPPLKHYFRREPERSRRVLRLVFANILAQCDRPNEVRPRFLYPQHVIYETDEVTPPAVRALGSEKLRQWVEDSYAGLLLPGYQHQLAMLRREAGLFEEFRLAIAIRAYTLDHGARPRTYKELLGPYLKTLPNYLGPDDPVPMPTPGPGDPLAKP
jgi:hypothetical protein